MKRAIFPALAVLALAAASGCTSDGRAATAPEPPSALPVRAVAISRGKVARPVRAAGTLAAKDEWDLSFKVGGVVARMEVREGDPIRRGQLLALLDSTEVEAGVRQAREALAKAERDRDRVQVLRASEAIPKLAGDDAQTVVAVARATLDAAAFNLRNAALFAPDDGWVDKKLAEKGEVVGPGRPVLHVSGRGRGLVVRANLVDRDILGLSPGDAATVTVDALPGVEIPGRVTELARSASRGTGTFLVEIALDAARSPRELLAGLTAKVAIERTVEAGATVPLVAVQDGDGARGAVFVLEGERARRVPVRIAFLKGAMAVLESDLTGADHVVTEGATRLADGARVHLVP
jgi:RND family efflux transporter MFP subunit